MGAAPVVATRSGFDQFRSPANERPRRLRPPPKKVPLKLPQTPFFFLRRAKPAPFTGEPATNAMNIGQDAEMADTGNERNKWQDFRF